MGMLLWPDQTTQEGVISEEQPSLTPFLLEGEKLFPVMIVCPGGAYMARAYHEGEPVARWLNSIGISAFVLNYRVSPIRYPAQLEDAQRAIRMVRANAHEWNVDPNRIGIIGFSAGGHLASMAGTHFDSGNPSDEDPIDRQSCRPDLMVLGYPVITMSDDFTSKGSREALLGERQFDSELVDFLSNQKQITANTPPSFVWHTVEDTGVPLENSLLFVNELRKHGIPFAFHLFESGAHGIGLAEGHLEANHWPKLCEEWLRKRRFLTSGPIFGEFSTVGDILGHEEAVKILERHLPGLSQAPQIEYAKGFTLKMLAGFPNSPISKELLQVILSDLALVSNE